MFQVSEFLLQLKLFLELKNNPFMIVAIHCWLLSCPDLFSVSFLGLVLCVESTKPNKATEKSVSIGA